MKNKPIKETNVKPDTETQLERKKMNLQAQKGKLTNKILAVDQQILEVERQIRELCFNIPESEGGDVIITVRSHINPPESKK